MVYFWIELLVYFSTEISIQYRGFCPQHRKVVCWLPLQTASEGSFLLRNLFIFCTAC